MLLTKQHMMQGQKDRPYLGFLNTVNEQLKSVAGHGRVNTVENKMHPKKKKLRNSRRKDEKKKTRMLQACWMENKSYGEPRGRREVRFRSGGEEQKKKKKTWSLERMDETGQSGTEMVGLL